MTKTKKENLKILKVLLLKFLSDYGAGMAQETEQNADLITCGKIFNKLKELKCQ